MAEHTPLPWHADPDDREGYKWNIHILDETGINRICFMSNGPQAEANAAFIVKAINSYNPMCEALKRARVDIEAALQYVEAREGNPAFGLRQTLEIIEAAIRDDVGNAQDGGRR